MRTHDYAWLAVAAFILVGVFAILPNIATANDAAPGNPYDIDILALDPENE